MKFNCEQTFHSFWIIPMPIKLRGEIFKSFKIQQYFSGVYDLSKINLFMKIVGSTNQTQRFDDGFSHLSQNIKQKTTALSAKYRRLTVFSMF